MYLTVSEQLVPVLRSELAFAFELGLECLHPHSIARKFSMSIESSDECPRSGAALAPS